MPEQRKEANEGLATIFVGDGEIHGGKYHCTGIIMPDGKKDYVGSRTGRDSFRELILKTPLLRGRAIRKAVNIVDDRFFTGFAERTAKKYANFMTEHGVREYIIKNNGKIVDGGSFGHPKYKRWTHRRLKLFIDALNSEPGLTEVA